MLVSSFNLSLSFNYAPYLFGKKTVQKRDQLFLYIDPGEFRAYETPLFWIIVPEPE
jgi:hypothetical protein